MLFACGSNGNGQLGLGHTEDMRQWTPVPNIGRVVEVAGGGNHTLMLLATGQVLGSGRAAEDQLGAESTRFEPVGHPEGRAWTHVAAGWAFSVLVDDAWQVWTCGTGSKGELATESTRHGLEMVWKATEPVAAVKSTMAHTLLLLQSGEVVGWGASRKGQLGVAQPKVVQPRTLCSDGQEICLGPSFSGVLLRDGTVKKFGEFPADVPNCRVLHIAAGWTSAAFIDELGFQIGGPSRQTAAEPGLPSHWYTPPLRHPERIVAGSEHYLAIKDGKVFAWGWGEHGNCPEPVEAAATGIFAGCATSFYAASE